MSFLQFRMTALIGVLFAIVYAIVVMFGTAMGVGNFYFYLLFSFGLMFVQYLLGPKMVEWSMKVHYLERHEFPELFEMVEDQARRAGIPVPRIGMSKANIPNAFAFGRGINDGRVCVTEPIVKLLSPQELKAVIGHEISHLKNRDVITVTILSVIPMVLYRIAWHFLFFGRFNRQNRDGGATIFIGLAAFLFYFLTNLLVLYASRLREYFADQGSVELGNRPEDLATALYKLVYGSARIPKEQLKEAEGMKAFFVNDPSRAVSEIKELRDVDVDQSGTIDAAELALLRDKGIAIDTSDKMMEAFSTHPNMVKRLKHLAGLGHYS